MSSRASPRAGREISNRRDQSKPHPGMSLAWGRETQPGQKQHFSEGEGCGLASRSGCLDFAGVWAPVLNGSWVHGGEGRRQRCHLTLRSLSHLDSEDNAHWSFLEGPRRAQQVTEVWKYNHGEDIHSGIFMCIRHLTHMVLRCYQFKHQGKKNTTGKVSPLTNPSLCQGPVHFL